MNKKFTELVFRWEAYALSRSRLKLRFVVCLAILGISQLKAESVRPMNRSNSEKISIAGNFNNTSTLLQQVSGVARDSSTNEPLVGVSVGIQGTTIGAITDGKGAFSLEVPNQRSVLIFSYMGYKTRTLVAGTNTKITITLARIETSLNEVVVIGYGTRAKGAVTGAVSSVKAEAFESRPLNNTFDALQGALPGVTITRASGTPGNQGYTLQVRGYSSINGNQPFILVDGVPGDINTINPSDISDITVLKDAAAAIYGNRAADGVILVTTKKGKNGPPVVQYSSNVALKTPNFVKKTMNTLEYAHFLDEGLRNVGITGISQAVFDKIQANAAPDLTQGWNYGLTNYPGFYTYTNWTKEIYKNSSQQYHNVSVTGGGDHNSYLFSAGYNRDNGTIKYGDNYSERYNLRLNYDFRLTPKLNVQTRSTFENSTTHAPTALADAVVNSVRQLPFAPVYNQVGQFYGYQGYSNPAQALEQGGISINKLSRFNTNFKVDYNILEGLTLTGQAAFRFDFENDNAITKTYTRYNYIGAVQSIVNDPNSATYANDQLLYKLYQVYADYNKKFGNGHKINLTIGTSLEQTNVQGQTITGYNFPGNEIFTLNLADRTNLAYSNYSGSLTNQALNSYFGRFSYSFRNKLILDITGRADGSSKFAPEKRWSQVFPSAALAYNLTEENFIKKLEFFDQFKLRVSYGRVGNQDISSLGLFDYSPLITVGGKYPLGSPNAGLAGAVADPASTDRTWETVETKNIGIDLQLFRSRLGFSFDYFNKTNENMLVAVAVPATYGGVAPTTNQGKLVTKGFETTLSWKDHIDDFRYNISLQLSDNNYKLVQLKNSDSYQQGLNFARQGYPIYSYFGYDYAGIIQTQDQLNNYKKLGNVPAGIAIGDVMYNDLDGDGKLTPFGDKTKGLAGDMKFLGSLIPRYTYSANVGLGYKQFDLSVFLQGVGKRAVQYTERISTPNEYFWPSLSYYYGKTWSPTNTNAQYPRYIAGSVGYNDIRNYDYQTSTLVIQNAAYLRFKVITLGYNLPVGLASKMKIRSLRIYASGQDLFTISKGTLGGNFDPEDGYRDERAYPFNKTFSLGIDVKF